MSVFAAEKLPTVLRDLEEYDSCHLHDDVATTQLLQSSFLRFDELLKEKR